MDWMWESVVDGLFDYKAEASEHFFIFIDSIYADDDLAWFDKNNLLDGALISLIFAEDMNSSTD